MRKQVVFAFQLSVPSTVQNVIVRPVPVGMEYFFEAFTVKLFGPGKARCLFGQPPGQGRKTGIEMYVSCQACSWAFFFASERVPPIPCPLVEPCEKLFPQFSAI